ncbi:thiamine-phosphate kinase [Elstera cyanobacteriorum]|uniref:thiamine-phosphate kinase n=1 Tax=Elstera cyanobacteriorum TaxID=2022747 RepID=UPI002352A1CD|nr:thiamine-phosphate kinase [Elstera cyanobacteriorum]MCK6442216.1 thiamine-phosphate kinase [Elstera cyanobacteriorum]
MTAGGEFERIARYFAPLAAGFTGALGLTDDAALLDPGPGRELVVSTDAQVADVHFFGGADPALIAAKILRSSVSDLAAMGAEPLAYTLATFWTDAVDSAWLARFSTGLAREQAALGINLAGGDTVRTAGPLSFSVTVFGSVPKGQAIRRAGAQVGDLVAVTGTIGDAWLGYRLLSDPALINDWGLSEWDAADLTERYWRPSPRCDTLARLRGEASAAVDISDGLIADLGHIAQTSGVEIVLDAAAIPLSPAARRPVAGFSLADLVTGGDDYEIALTISPQKAAMLDEAARASGVPITIVGRCTAGAGVRMRDRAGNSLPIGQAGFRHF